jgi:hypothetical protein
MFLINPYILQASGNPLWDGLLAYYTADNTPNDALGTYNGTLVNGATYGTGIINQGFSLDGVNDYVDFGNVLDFDGSAPLSISAWVNINSGTGNKSILSKMNSSSPNDGYQFWVSNRSLQFAICSNINTDAVYVYSTSNAVPLSTWCHCVVTYDGSKTAAGVNLYIDGSVNNIIFTDNFTGTSANSYSANIGARSGTNNFFNGLVDEVATWNRELTASEVTELYNSGAGLQY